MFECYSDRMFRYWLALFPVVLAGADIVSFPSGDCTLQGALYKPEGRGPFPAVLFNHGSGKDYTKQFEALVPVFFAPYRRGKV